MLRLVVLYNPAAGGGLDRTRLEALVRRAPELAGALLRPVRSVEDASDAVARLSDSVDAVVAAGGDGTVNLVATALLEQGADTRRPPPLAVLPLGTGNAFAHGVGVRSRATALRTLGAPRETRVDVMRTTHPDAPVALVSLSTGLEGRFIHAYAARRARWSRAGAAIAASVRALRAARAHVRLITDGAPLCDARDETVNAGLYNLPYYGFGRAMWPDARGCDGVGEAVVCRTRRRYGRVLARGLRTAPACDVVDPRWARFREATLETDDLIQVDGDVLAPASITVRMEAAALRVLVPPEPAEPAAHDPAEFPLSRSNEWHL